MDKKYFESDNPDVLAKAIRKAIATDRNSQMKQKMREGVDYYNFQHDILKFRLFYFDDEGNMVEEANRSNIKIPHAYFTELVDQKVQYQLSNPVEVYTDDTTFKEYLAEYIDEEFQVMLQEALEGSSKKGYEFIYSYINSDNIIAFKVADSLKVIVIYDSFGKVIKIIRYYSESIQREGKLVNVVKAELWDEKQTWFFVTDENRNFILDHSEEVNPKPHQLLMSDDGNLYGKGFGYIPFFKLSNNKPEKTDLEPIKPLIDDYDLMACALSNNLVDFDHPIYAVKGYAGDNLDTLVTNLRTKKTIGTSQEGGIDVKTVDIPVNAREAKLKIDKEGIYKFGMGFDSSQMGDGNVTNVVIKSRYSLLDLKCNKSEVRLRRLIKQLLKVIVEDINRRYGTDYDANPLQINITRDTIVNEKDVIDQGKIKEETRQILIQNILDIAPRIDDDTVLKELCEAMELDYDKVIQQLGAQDYKEPEKELTSDE